MINILDRGDVLEVKNLAAANYIKPICFTLIF